MPVYQPEAYLSYAAPVFQADLGLFGLLPAWAKDRAFGKRTYNARSETVAEKPSYRSAWAKREYCLIPMEQFFEPCWQTGKAVRWSIYRLDQNPFAVAAIWDSWTDRATGEIVRSFSMLTINADGHRVMGRFHKPTDERRSLVVIPPSCWSSWLVAKPLDAAAMMLPMDEKEFAAAPAEVHRAKAADLF